MTFRYLSLAVCVPLLLVGANKVHGPFKPVIAQQKITYFSRDLQGNEKILYEYTGQYLRLPDGSELATLGPVNGKATEARLRLAADGTTYKLDFKRKTATLMATEKIPLAPKSSDKGSKAKEKISGRVCSVEPVKSFGMETGTSYRDTKDDVLIRLISYFGSKEDQVRVVMERFNITTRDEPDASYFAIPGGWTVIAPSQPKKEEAVPKPEPMKLAK